MIATPDKPSWSVERGNLIVDNPEQGSPPTVHVSTVAFGLLPPPDARRQNIAGCNAAQMQAKRRPAGLCGKYGAVAERLKAAVC